MLNSFKTLGACKAVDGWIKVYFLFFNSFTIKSSGSNLKTPNIPGVADLNIASSYIKTI